MPTLLYQQTGRYFAQISDPLEELGALELRELGAGDVQTTYRGIRFSADPATLYRVTYRSRLVTRVLAPLVTFHCHSSKYLYKRVAELPWTDLMRLDDTFAVFSSVSNSKIIHSQYAALVVKDAIADTFRSATGARPNVDTKQPRIWIGLHIQGDKATVSLDASGGSLHRRGYRKQAVEAPIMETVAAAMLRLCEWDGSTPLYDPMCGSGTLLIEGLMAYCRIPAAYLRKHFGFQRFPDYDAAVWRRERERAAAEIRALPEGWIAGSDAAASSVDMARANARLLPHGAQVVLRVSRFQELDALRGVTVVTNPPYGKRLQGAGGMERFMKEFGDFLKKRCAGSTAYVYFGDRELLKRIRLRPAWRKPLKNGGLDGRLAKFEMYEGTAPSSPAATTAPVIVDR